MRIPFPERIAYSHALAFGALLSAVQLLEHTDPIFSGCCFLFILVATVGFNVCGGMFYCSGAFIGCNAIMTVILSMVAKAFFREPASSNLLTPAHTMEVYLCGMVAMTLAGLAATSFRPRKAYLSDMLPLDKLRTSAYGCAVLGAALSVVQSFMGGGNGTISSFIGQVNRFPMLAIVLGVIYIIRSSGGRRSISRPLLLYVCFSASFGILSFSKEVFLFPFFCWAVPVALLRYKLHPINIVLFLSGIYVVVTYMVPYAQVGRDFDYPGHSPMEVSAYLITHMDEVDQSYKQNQAGYLKIHYYNEQHGLLDRVNLISVDDALIDVTDREGRFGYEPLVEAYENGIPHFLWKDKPVPYFGNVYAHQIGILSDEDRYTGVSFSPTADAYHEGGMFGVLVVEPLVMFLSFLVLDWVVGDVRRNPVGLLMTMLIARGAGEGLLGGVPYLLAQPLVATIMCAFFCAHVLPIIGGIVNRHVPDLAGAESNLQAVPSS
jgi:hypothetical protein